MSKRRPDVMISAALALVLIATIAAIVIGHGGHSVQTVQSAGPTTAAADNGGTAISPTPRAAHHKHAAKPGTVALPNQPVAPNAQGGQPTNTGVVSSKHYALTPRLRAMVPTSTVLVHLVHPTRGFASATAKKSDQMIPARWYGYYSVLPVVGSGNFRLQVRLPRRPNESTAWVKADKVRYSRTPYAILVDLKYRRLFVFNAGHLIGSYPVGIGAPDDPTPTGSFFVAFRSPPPDPSYGPFVLATSGHSNAIADFEGGGDAIIAIHGPIDAAGSIGGGGAAISHGCIRMLDPDLAKLSGIPTGTPVIVTY